MFLIGNAEQVTLEIGHQTNVSIGNAERPCVARSLNENTTKTLNQFETQGHHKAPQQKHRTDFHKVIMRLLNRNTKPAFGKVITRQLPKGNPEAGFARQARQTTVSQRKKRRSTLQNVSTGKNPQKQNKHHRTSSQEIDSTKMQNQLARQVSLIGKPLNGKTSTATRNRTSSTTETQT